MADIHEIRRSLKLDALVPLVGSRAGRWTPSFHSGEIVSEPRPVLVNPLGTTLKVPDQHQAVLVGNGRRFLVAQGFHYLDLPTGYYDARCVQMFQQITTLGQVSRPSRDGLDVTLAARLTWRVVDPLAVLDKRQFQQQVFEAGRAVMANFIRAQRYNRLVQTPDGVEAMAPAEIGGHLRQNLLLKRIFRGLELLDVLVEPPQGVRELQEAAQNLQVEASIIEAERQLLDQRTELEGQKLEQRRTLETRKAVVERQVLAEQQQNRLVETEMDQRVTAMRRPMLDQELEYQARRDQIELRRVGGQMVLESRKEVLLRLVESLTGSLMAPNMMGQMGMVDAATIRELVETVLQGLDPAMLALGDGNGASAVPETAPIILRLVREVTEIELRLPEVQWQGLLAENNGEYRVQFAYKAWMIKLYVRDEYPRSGPRVAIHRSGNRSAAEGKANTFQPSWNPRKRLIDLLVYITNRIDSPRGRGARPGEDNPFDMPPTYAG